MKLQKALEIQPGVTAIIGGGGKTTLMECLAEELSAQARVIVCTTTHIYPEQNMPCLVSPSEAEVEAELARTHCVCVGSASESGKFSAPELTFRTLCALADYVFVEADGSKRLPLKAHAAHEPVIPPEANQTILVVGASGFGRPMRESVHRAPIAAQALDVSEDTTVTPELWAKFLNLEALHTRVLVNQTENEPEQQAAKALAAGLSLPGVHGGAAEGVDRMLVLIRGAGDLATGIALRLFRSHLCVVMTDLPQPTAIRRTVCFSQAILYGSYQVEDVTAELAATDGRCAPYSG